MNRKYIIGSLVLWAPMSTAQAETGCHAERIAELPVTMSGLTPQVHVKINGKDALFIADSGAWYSMISPGSAAEFGLKLVQLPEEFYLTGMGGTVTPQLTTVDSFTIAGIPIPHVQFLVGGSEMGSVGLLGQNVLALADTEFDLANGMIRLIRSRGCGKSNLAYWAKAGEAYSMLQTEVQPTKQPHIFAPVYVNGIKLRALFDTGASTSFLSMRAAESVGLKPRGAGVTSAGETGGLGRAWVSTWVGPVGNVKIGDEEIRNTRLRFGGDLDGADMLVGADFFLSHHVYWSNSARKIFFTFNGGSVFNLHYFNGRRESEKTEENPSPLPSAGAGKVAPTSAIAGDTAPPDAEGFSRRSGARAARGDFRGALADLDQAVRLAPEDISDLRQRGGLRAKLHQLPAALEDIDRLLRLKPDDADALVMRAGLRFSIDRKADIRADINAAAATAAKAFDQRLNMAELYEAIDAFPEAIAQYDLWIEAHPDDNRRPMALNGRCWARAMANLDLDRALKDCNRALSATPHAAAILDSRGMVRLRMGDQARAIADYNEALKSSPNTAWSLYGRGIAQLRQGKKAEGEADLAKAGSLEPGLAEKARQRGIVP